MSIEATLTSIDESLKKLVALAEKAPAAPVKSKPAKEEKVPTVETKTETKIETKAPEADPFADDSPPAKPATKDEVRAALVAYQQAKSKELGDDGKGKAAALALMAEKGGGAKTITELFTGGKQQDVYDAIKASFGDKFEAAVAAAGASLKK